MIIRIQKRDNPFVQIDKRPLEDERLSWKAKGLLAHLLCKPDTWEISVADLVSRSRDGREALQSALRELKQLGYATLESKRGEGGRLLGKTWVIYELPTDGKPVFRLATDERENRPTGKPSNGKTAPSNNILEERIKEQGEGEPRAPELKKKEEKPVIADLIDKIRADHPGKSDGELRVIVLTDQVKAHFRKYPADARSVTENIGAEITIRELREEVEKWVRYWCGKDAAFASDPIPFISRTLKSWLVRWASGKREELRRSGAASGVYEKPKV